MVKVSSSKQYVRVVDNELRSQRIIYRAHIVQVVTHGLVVFVNLSRGENVRLTADNYEDLEKFLDHFMTT